MEDPITLEIAAKRRDVFGALGAFYRLIHSSGGDVNEQRVLVERHRKAVFAAVWAFARLVRLGGDTEKLVGLGFKVPRGDEAAHAHVGHRSADARVHVLLAESANHVVGMNAVEGAKNLLDEHDAPEASLEDDRAPQELEGLGGVRVADQVAKGLPENHSASPHENGAPRSESDAEAAPGTGERQPTGDPSKASCSELQSRQPELNRRPADYEFAGDASPFSPRLVQLATLAWELIERDPKLAARVAFDVLEVDEHDPAACVAVCCNSPLALEVRP